MPETLIFPNRGLSNAKVVAFLRIVLEMAVAADMPLAMLEQIAREICQPPQPKPTEPKRLTRWADFSDDE
jgi:hypothetical protein